MTRREAEDDGAPGAPPEGYDPLTGESGYPFQRMLGFRIAAWAEDYARVEMPFEERHRNRYGIPHGGLYASLIDTACGYAGCWCPYPGRRRLAMTLSLTTNFLGRPKLDETGEALIIAEGRRIGGGRSSFFTEAVVKDAAGALLATGGGVFRYRGNGGDLRGDPAAE